MQDFHLETLIHDPIHGYIPIGKCDKRVARETPDVAEEDVINHPTSYTSKFLRKEFEELLITQIK